jgi:hypothetical protein
MDTWPGHAQVIKPESLWDKSIPVGPDRRCPRERFFVEARKRDDGDAVRIAEER